MDAVKRLNRAIALAREVGDNGSRDLLGETHARRTRRARQLARSADSHQLEQLGELYLSQQIREDDVTEITRRSVTAGTRVAVEDRCLDRWGPRATPSPPSAALLALEGRAWHRAERRWSPLCRRSARHRAATAIRCWSCPDLLADDASTFRAAPVSPRPRLATCTAGASGAIAGPIAGDRRGAWSSASLRSGTRHGRAMSVDRLEPRWHLRSRARARHRRTTSGMVITLASPFRDPDATNVARLAVSARRARGRPARRRVPVERLRGSAAGAVHRPSTAQTDGIVSRGRAASTSASPRRENLAVRAATAAWAITRRSCSRSPIVSAQPGGAWRPLVPARPAGGPSLREWPQKPDP